MDDIKAFLHRAHTGLIGAFREEDARLYLAQSHHVLDPAGRSAKNTTDAESLRSCNTRARSRASRAELNSGSRTSVLICEENVLG